MNDEIKENPVGFLKNMFDRFKSNLAYLQMPLLFYTAVVSTINYIPALSGYLTEFMIVFFIGFFIFMGAAIYIDYKWVFPNERDFLFKHTPYLKKRFDGIDDKLDRLL